MMLFFRKRKVVVEKLEYEAFVETKFGKQVSELVGDDEKATAMNAWLRYIKEKMLSANIAKKYKSELTDEDYQSIAAGYIRSYYAATDEVKAQFKSDNGIAQSAVRAMISIIKKGK